MKLSKKLGALVISTIIIIILGSTNYLNSQNTRTLSGIGNNLFYTDWGSAGSNVIISSTRAYGDQISSPSGVNRPNPRFISNEIFAQNEDIDDPLGLSAYAWAWGQFIDHDITLSPDNPNESFNIPVPAFDAYFDPNGTGIMEIPMHRSEYDPATGTDFTNPRTHINAISAFIDASTVYGSDAARANWLRTFADGKLKTSTGNLLPYNTLSGEAYDIIDPNAPGMAMPYPFVDRFFIAGDVRANENPLLTSLHTVFVREHNRLCDELIIENPDWTDELLYQRARKIVGALIEAVVYEEWLPVLGLELEAYQGYDQTVQPGIMNVFSTAAYRYGHSVIGGLIVRMNDEGEYVPEGNISLTQAFFNPAAIPSVGGIEPYLIGMATVVEQDFDCSIIDDLRNFLFGAPGSGGLDLASLNIQRGRDRGLADYNTIRTDFDLDPISSFASLTSDPLLNQQFSMVYGDIDKIDPWVGLLAENHMDEALFGPTAMAIIKKQFGSLRDGDRLYYEADVAFYTDELAEIKSTRLSDIIRRNTGITFMQDNVFVVEENSAIVDIRHPGLEFALYPNPANDNITLELGNEIMTENLEFHILDMFGKVVLTGTNDQFSGDGMVTIALQPELPNGLYQVLIFDRVNYGAKSFLKISH